MKQAKIHIKSKPYPCSNPIEKMIADQRKLFEAISNGRQLSSIKDVKFVKPI